MFVRNLDNLYFYRNNVLNVEVNNLLQLDLQFLTYQVDPLNPVALK